MEEKNIEQLNYLEQSLLLGHLLYKYKVFLGNWYSLFSQQLILAREESQTGPSFVYNPAEVVNMRIKVDQ